MATVTSSITLSSSAGQLLTNAFSYTLSESLTATHTSGLGRTIVTATAAGATATVLFDVSQWSDSVPSYMFLHNTDSTATNYIYVYIDSASDDPVVVKLGGGNFAFIPLNGNESQTADIKAYSTAGTEVLEFMVFGTEG